MSSNDDAFLNQLYSAFNSDTNKAMDFSEFADGLSIFIKGNDEEKLSCKYLMLVFWQKPNSI